MTNQSDHMQASPHRPCPRCGTGELHSARVPNSLSVLDSLTELCNDCGTAEQIEDMHGDLRPRDQWAEPGAGITPGYVLGAAGDPHAERRQIRNEVEREIQQALITAGCSRTIAIEAAGGIVGACITRGDQDPFVMAEKLAGRDALAQLVWMRSVERLRRNTT